MKLRRLKWLVPLLSVVAVQGAARPQADFAWTSGPPLIAPPKDGAVTYADLFTVEPFNNTLVVMTLTGAQVERVLQQSLDSAESQALQVSAGFSYAWRQDASGKAVLVPGSVTVNGKPLDPAASYRIVTNSFLADGGDAAEGFRQGTRRAKAGSDTAALEAWLKAASPLAPTPRDRIRLAP